MSADDRRPSPLDPPPWVGIFTAWLAGEVDVLDFRGASIPDRLADLLVRAQRDTVREVERLGLCSRPGCERPTYGGRDLCEEHKPRTLRGAHPRLVEPEETSIPGWRGLEPTENEVLRQMRESDGVRRPLFRIEFSPDWRPRDTLVFMDGDKVSSVVAVRVHSRRPGQFDTYVVFRVKDAELVNLPKDLELVPRLDVSVRKIPGWVAGQDTWLG